MREPWTVAAHIGHKAIADFDKALEISPNYPSMLSNRGRTYVDLGQVDRGLIDIERSLAISPVANAYKNRGIAYIRKGELDRGISDLNRAIELDPRIAQAMRIGRSSTSRGTAST